MGTAGVFISYRREDASGQAGRLYDRLVEKYGRDWVFRDIDAVKPGTRFDQKIDEAVASCSALIAVIGREWLAAKDRSGTRRLDNPRDWVRLEIAAALEKNVLVIPVLVEDAMMPSEDDLPDLLKPLSYIEALELTERHWNSDVGLLEGALEEQTDLGRVADPSGSTEGSESADTGGAVSVDAETRAAPEPPLLPLPPTPPRVESTPPFTLPTATKHERSAWSTGPFVLLSVASLLTGGIVGVIAGALGFKQPTRNRRARLLLALSVLWLVLAAGGFFIWRVLGPGPREWTVVISGKEAWTDTRVNCEPGQVLDIRADGLVRHNEMTSTGPEGDENRDLQQYNVIGSAAHAALIGRIDDQQSFPVGKRKSLVCPFEGPLFLGVNDSGVENNDGQFRARIIKERKASG